MGRTIRRVPLNWQHPKDSQDRYIPLHDKTYLEAFSEWQGDRTYPEAIYDMLHSSDRPPTFAEYRPCWPRGEKLGYQVYSEVWLMGFPVSPVLPSRIETLSWMVLYLGYNHRDATICFDHGFTNRPDHLRQQFGKPFDRFGGKENG